MAVNGGADLVAVPESARRALAGIIQSRGWTKPELHVETGSNDGDGYLSALHRVVIRNEDDSISLMCKTTMASMDGAPFIARAFKAENFVYNRLLPAMEEIAQLKGPLPWPRAYPTDLQSACVVMEDMRPKGFGMSERGIVLDEKRCRLLLSQLAKFHGAGMALDKFRPDLIADLKAISDDPSWIAELKKVFDPFVKACANAPEMITDRFPEGSPVNEKLKGLFAKFSSAEGYFEHIRPDPEGGNSVGHGDCHINNVLFQKNEAGAVVGCCLIDFQIVRYSWPPLDFAIILMCTTEKAMRDEYWESLMRGYFDELHSTLRAGGIEDPDSVYSWERFQLRRGVELGVCMTPAFLHVFSDDTAVKDVQDTLAQTIGDQPKESTAFVIKATPLIQRRFGDVVQSMIEWGWL